MIGRLFGKRPSRVRGGIGVGERLRIQAIGAVFAVLGLTVAGRLVDLQAVPDSGIASALRRQHYRAETIAAERGRVLDRNGVVLAADRPLFEVRAEIKLPVLGEGAVAGAERRVFRLTDDLHLAFGRDAERFGGFDGIDRLRRKWRERLERAYMKAVRTERTRRAAGKAARDRVWIDFLVHTEVDSGEVIAAIRALDYRGASSRVIEKRGYAALIHTLSRYERVYPQRELTYGLVGYREGEQAVAGLEVLPVVARGANGERVRRVDAVGRGYWTSLLDEPETRLDLRTTIDIELQAHADRLLGEAVAGVTEVYESPPEWGALVLADVQSGELLAMASWQTAKDGTNNAFGPFAPTQSAFEPGSVVKPLHIAFGLQRGTIDWNEIVDCRRGFRPAIPGRRPGRREIRDSHDCYDLTPHGILVESSNIGAVKLGLRLGPDGLQDYLEFYQLGEPTGLPLPHERRGRRPALRNASLGEQWIYGGPSAAFGYQIETTPVQIVRAFLTLLSGRQRELRLIRSAATPDGTRRIVPPRADEDAPRVIDQVHVERIRAAMIGVVSPQDRATGRPLAALLQERGIPLGLIGGKTGTSEYGPPGSKTRTASFAGFANDPRTGEPRFLAFGVVQKKGASSFYGGRYTAPYAGRLLLRALERSQQSSSRDQRGRPDRAKGGSAPDARESSSGDPRRTTKRR